MVHHGVDGVLQLKDFALHVHGDLARQVAAGHGGGHFGDVTHLGGQVCRQQVDVIGQILPRAGDARHLGLTAELAVGTDLARHAGHFAGEGVQLVDHGVHGLFELQDFAAHVDGDLLGQVAAGDGGCHVGDVTHLGGEVGLHEVDVVGEILPRAGHTRHLGLTAELAFGADFARHAGHFAGERIQLVHHRIDGVLELENFALHVYGDLAAQVAARYGRGHFGDVAHLAGQVAGHGVHGVRQILPGAGDAGHLRLTAELAVGTDLARHAGHFAGEGVQLVDHGVHGLFELQDFAAHVDGDLLGQVAAGDGGRHFGDIAHLACQVRRHEVHVVSEILPRAGDAGHLGLTAELAVGPHFARHAGHFAGEGVELIDHGVERVLQLEDLALHVDGDLLGQVAAGHRGCHFSDVADLRRQVGRHGVDVVGQILPRAGHAGHGGLTAELAVGPHFARHARHFAGERVQLVHHSVQGILQQKDLARHVHGDLARQVAGGHRRGHFGDVAHLGGQVTGHGVDRVRQILPRSRHALHDRLAAKLAVGTHFARHARHFRGERIQLVDGGVEGVLQFQDFARHVDGDLLGQVAVGDSRGDVGDVAHLGGQVARHEVHVVGQILPRPGDARHLGLTAELAFGAHFARHAGHFAREGVQLVHHGVDGLFELQDFARHVHGDLLGQIAAGDGGGHFGDVAHLSCKIGRHEVDVVGEILPRPGDAGHLRLTAELSFGSDLARHARHFTGEGVQLVHHRIDGVLQFEDFALHVHGDLAAQVAARNRRGHLRDVAHLVGQVAAHRVDGVGQVFPCPRHARHDRLAAELAVGAHFARDARHFRGEGAQLVHHGVDGFLQLKDFAAHVDGDLLRQVAVGHGDGHVGDVAHLRRQVGRHRVHGLGQFLPHAGHFRHLRLTAELAVGADFARHAGHFRREHRKLLDHGVDDGGGAQEFALQRAAVHVQPHRLQQVALRHGGDHARHFRRRPHQVVDQGVDRPFHLAPRAAGIAELHALARAAFLADHLADALQLLRHILVRADDVVEQRRDLGHDAVMVARQAHGEVACAHRLQGVQQVI